MSIEESKAVARRLFTEVWSEGKLNVLDEILTSDFRTRAGSQEIHGPEGFKQFVSTFRTAFPDFRVTVEDQIAEGDRVVSRWTAMGTHRGAFRGISPTGNPVKIAGITIFKIEGGRIAQGWAQFDAVGLMQQLGAGLP